MDPGEAARRVLDEAGGEALHWTVIWDRALRTGLINPMEQPDARDQLMRRLSAAAKAGEIEKTSTGTYRSKGERRA